MTDLLKDLAEVVRLLDEPKDGLYSESAYKCTRFVRDHAAEIEADKRDAERYRWLRGLESQFMLKKHGCGMLPMEDELGEEIDAAMRSAKED